MEIKAKINRITSADDLISEYVTNVSMMNKLTAKEYYARLKTFQTFVENKYSLGVNAIISKLRRIRKIPTLFSMDMLNV